MRNGTWVVAASIAASVLLLLACESGKGGGTPANDGDGPQWNLTEKAALTAFDACLDMEAYFTDLAVAELLRGAPSSGGTTDGGSWVGFDAGSWGGWPGGADVAAPSADVGGGSWSGGGSSGGSGGAGDGSGDGPGRPTDGTGTNNQTEGVDEADIVKRDGALVYVVAGDTLHVIEAWPAEDTREIGTLELDHAPFELFVEDDVALLFTRLGRHELPADLREAVRPDRDLHEFLRLTFVDLADPAAPRVARTLDVEASYVSARLVDGIAYVVGRSSASLDRGTSWDVPTPWDGGGGRPDAGWDPPPVGVDVGWWGADASGGFDAGSWGGPDVGPADPWPPAADGGASLPPAPDTEPWPQTDAGARYERRRSPLTADEAEEAVRAIIARRTAEDWLPRYRDAVLPADGPEQVTSGLIVACDDVYRPTTPYGQDLLVVLAVDLTDPAAPHGAQAVIGGAETIYASGQSLYVAATKAGYWYYDGLDPAEREVTAIHKFAFEDGLARYAASGEVAGRLLNQFALDEYEDHLRVATTTGWTWTSEIESHVLVLADRQGELTTVGHLDDIGRGEDLYAVRFLGDRGFVVTFLQTDPLFTIDLANPRTPRLLGELQVPGFSTYLHPMDDDHLLAIGQSANWGVKLSIFDVSDLAHPRMVVEEELENASSEAQYDHRAFTYYPSEGVLVVPVESWGWYAEAAQNEVRVFDVSADAGIRERGSIDHGALLDAAWESLPDEAWCWVERDEAGAPRIRRTLFLDSFLYAVSDAGLTVTELAALDATLATVPFEDECTLAAWCSLPGCSSAEPYGW